MLKLNHKNLDVWQLAVKFISLVHRIISKYPKDELFGLTNQTKRASVSISANIAEGSPRKSLVERKRFYEIAKSSLVEVDNHLGNAITLNYLDAKAIKEIDEKLNELFVKFPKFIERAELITI